MDTQSHPREIVKLSMADSANRFKRREVLLNSDDTQPLANAVINGEYDILEVIKDDRKSYVARISVSGQELLYKENRFQTRTGRKKISQMLMNESSAFFQFKISKHFQENKVSTPSVVFAIEEKILGFRTLSIIVQNFETHTAEVSDIDYEQAYLQIRRINELGYLHADAGKNNFINTKNGLMTIDFRAKKNWFSALGIAFELVKFSALWGGEYKGKRNWAYHVSNFYFRAHRATKKYFWDFLRGARFRKSPTAIFPIWAKRVTDPKSKCRHYN